MITRGTPISGNLDMRSHLFCSGSFQKPCFDTLSASSLRLPSEWFFLRRYAVQWSIKSCKIWVVFCRKSYGSYGSYGLGIFLAILFGGIVRFDIAGRDQRRCAQLELQMYKCWSSEYQRELGLITNLKNGIDHHLYMGLMNTISISYCAFKIF